MSADTILADPTSAATFGYLVTRAAPDAGCAGCPGRIVSINQTNLNLGETHIKGFDTDIRYRIPTTARGVFTLGLQGTYFYRYDLQNPLDFSFSSINGKVTGINNGVGGAIPRWRHYLSLDWRLAPWTFALVQQYQAGYEDLAGNRPPNPEHRVGDYSVFHLYGSYTGLLSKNFKLTLAIRNLFDKDPPFTNAGGRNFFQGGYDPGYADPRGRMFLVAGTYKFM
jgi:iron complex outermembrane receptor protein